MSILQFDTYTSIQVMKAEYLARNYDFTLPELYYHIKDHRLQFNRDVFIVKLYNIARKPYLSPVIGLKSFTKIMEAERPTLLDWYCCYVKVHIMSKPNARYKYEPHTDMEFAKAFELPWPPPADNKHLPVRKRPTYRVVDHGPDFPGYPFTILNL